MQLLNMQSIQSIKDGLIKLGHINQNFQIDNLKLAHQLNSHITISHFIGNQTIPVLSHLRSLLASMVSELYLCSIALTPTPDLAPASVTLSFLSQITPFTISNPKSQMGFHHNLHTSSAFPICRTPSLSLLHWNNKSNLAYPFGHL